MSVRSRVKALEYEVSVLGFQVEYLLRRSGKAVPPIPSRPDVSEVFPQWKGER